LNFLTIPDLLKSQGGDQTALGNITADADAYLKLARDAYASSQQYTDIFNLVTGELANLAGTDTSGQPRVVTSDPFPVIAAALPTNGAKLASQTDIATMTTDILAGIAALADAGDGNTATVATALSQAKVAIVDAVNSGLK
jgi:hypothetical protein